MLTEEKAETMKRSPLEIHVEILEVLAQRSPLKLTHVMNDANVNCSMLKEYLVFLTKQGLVEEKIIGKSRKVYAITELGVTVLEQFRELKEVFHIVVKTGNKTRTQGP